ncbi:MAG: BrnT family toxin [bacterium]
MKLIKLLWDEENRAHIARHEVTPEEVEEICTCEDPKPRIEKGKKSRNRPGLNLYYVLGKTAGGRYIFIVFRPKRKGEARVITAREMDSKERSRYGRR